ncbi:MAG TPA: protein translocase subunit SecD [Thermoanaerobaculales bacterium]|nr:protein translocase subunit SecD [Thermoanaerobaculales bacterium]
MDRKIIWRIVIIVAVVAASVFALVQRRLPLGLDLSGGIHLVLQVETDDAIKAELDDAALRLKTRAGEKGITLGEWSVDVDKLTLRMAVPPNVDRNALRQLVDDFLPEYDLSTGTEAWSLAFKPNVEGNIRDLAVRQALETIRNRVDQFGVAEPVIQRQGTGNDRILVQLPGVDDPTRVKEIISNTAFLEWKEVIAGPAPSRDILLARTGGQVPSDAEVATEDREDASGVVVGKDYYLLRKAAIVTGRDLRTARRGQGQFGEAVVNFYLVPAGGDKFAEFTGAHIGDPAAIVLDGNVISAPVIRSRIRDEGYIEGNFSIETAEDLALKLRAGALPASINYLEERTVGPSLGRDSIVHGVRAGLVGLLLVIVFMVVYYKLSGLNAVFALILNVVILLGAMAYFGATLTLPGIAGIILTIGMAVDANVLIFERIREELAVGKTVRSAIDTGFSRAFVTILDSNLTTLIAALFLFQFGTGPVKGFAVTLSIGLVASMFTAVFVSRTLYMLLLASRDRVETLSV